MNPIIELYSWEYEHAYHVGIRRFTANWDAEDAEHYDRSRMEEDRNAQAAAAICELAVARYLGKYWHGGVWCRHDRRKYRHIADVGDNIEVRRSRTQDAIMVRKKDAGRIVWGARLVDKEYRSVEILGYISADEVIASLAGTYQDSKYVHVDLLSKPWLSAEAIA